VSCEVTTNSCFLVLIYFFKYIIFNRYVHQKRFVDKFHINITIKMVSQKLAIYSHDENNCMTTSFY